jgi:cadherin EGF LAG seven-pass G-type receptor 1
VNARISYELVASSDASWFRLVDRPSDNACQLLTDGEFDFESDRKLFRLTIRASSAPLRNDVEVEVYVTDVNDNAPTLRDFTIVFNNFRGHFPIGAIGRVPAHDIDVADKLQYRFLSGNRAQLLFLNESSGELSLSPHLNTNVPTRATFELSVTDGQNEATGRLHLQVNLVTELMLANSVQLRLALDSNRLDSLQTLFNRVQEALASLLHANRESVVVFDMQTSAERPEVTYESSGLGAYLNVSLAVRSTPESDAEEQYLLPDLLRERLYLGRSLFTQMAGMQVRPFVLQTSLCPSKQIIQNHFRIRISCCRSRRICALKNHV